jgi:polysaccharide biosynthesis protein PslG
MNARWRRVLVALAISALLVATVAVAVARSRPVRDWLWQATGEESLWEGIKGTVALALLQSHSPPLDLAPDAAVANLGVNPYGANVFLQLEADPENVRRSFALLRDAGIGWARQEFPWEDIEIHGRGDFQDRRNDPPRSAWDKYDRIVKTAADHHVNVLVRLDNPPDWAFADPAKAGEKGPPDNLADFGNFVAAVAGRYCGKVRYYQIWNEPNIYPEWGNRDADPAGYAALLKVAATRARQACPGVVIVSAALAQTTEPGGRNMDDLKYLEALYKAGWSNDFDVLGVQAFGLWTGPTDHRVSPDRANFVRPLLARDIMVRHGDGTKPVWITEMGWDSPPQDMPAPYGRIDEAGRARYTVAAYERMAQEWPWVGPAFVWFFRRPDFAWHQRPEGYFRLVEPDWNLTPTYTALAELANHRPVLMSRGRHQPDDWALTYDGPWRSEPATGTLQTRVGSRDAEVQFAFRGTGFQVQLAPPTAPPPASPTPGSARRAPARRTVASPGAGTPSPPAGEVVGTATPAASATPVPTATPRVPSLFMVVDQDKTSLTPQQAQDNLVFGRDGLPDGEHEVRLRVEAGEMRLKAIVVAAPDPPSVWAPLIRIGVGLVLVLLALLAVAISFRRWRAKRQA